MACIYTLAAGSVTLAGWWLDLPRLTDWLGSGISIMPNAALCAVLLGAGLLLAESAQLAWRRVARGAAGVALVIAVLTLVENLGSVNLGIDGLLAQRDWGQRGVTGPMRMGVPASISFASLAATLWLLTLGPAGRRAASIVVLVPLVVGFLSFTGYWFGAGQLYGIARLTAISLQTSVMVLALGIGALASIPEFGAVASLRRTDAGGDMLRWLTAPLVAAPFLLGWFVVLGERARLWDTPFGLSLLALMEVGLFLGLLWWAARRIGGYESVAEEARERLATIVQSADLAVLSESLDGVIQSWNAGAERLFGYTEAEAVGQQATLIVPPEHAQAERDVVARVLQGERIHDYETVRRGKDGGLIDVAVTASPVRDAAGGLVAVSCIARDITERKRAEETVRRNEAELQALADSIPQLAWMAQPDGHIFWYNRRWYEYTGTTLEDVVGWGWQSVHDPQALPRVMEAWRSSLAAGEEFEMEFQLRSAYGRFRWFLTRARPLRDEKGRVVRWFGTNTDIDQAKRTERTLRQQAHTLELLNQTASVVGSTLELEGLLQAITDIARQLSGAEFGAFFYNAAGEQGEPGELTTLSGVSREAFERLDHTRATPLFSPPFRSEGPVRVADVLQHHAYGQDPSGNGAEGGAPAVRSYLAVPVPSRGGGTLGGLVFGHSRPNVFTEQVERIIVGVAAQASVAFDNARLYKTIKQSAEERLRLLEAERAARAEAEHVNRLKDEFLATLSHELRTPLSAILGWAELLNLGGYQPDELEQGLDAIERNARAQTKLIEDLLDMSRIISGKVRLDVQPTDLAQVIEEAVASVRHSAEAKGIALRTVFDPHAGDVSGDPTRLQQVLWNLLTNAIKFTPKGGRVDIVLERVPSHVEVTVRDTGLGIRPEFLPLVFDRFRQADASATRRHGGLGLGLSIVKHLVELHGGTVSASSPGEGQGATFTVSLPLAPVRSATLREEPTSYLDPAAALAHVRLGGVRVLVVDDEPDARALLKTVLHRCDADVFTAGSAAEALDSLRAHRPDVIVSDIGMPGSDGYQFIRDVRKLAPQAGGQTPAIALTAFARPEDRTRAMLAGYQVHVAKPIEPHELIATVKSLVGRSA